MSCICMVLIQLCVWVCVCVCIPGSCVSFSAPIVWRQGLWWWLWGALSQACPSRRSPTRIPCWSASYPVKAPWQEALNSPCMVLSSSQGKTQTCGHLWALSLVTCESILVTWSTHTHVHVKKHCLHFWFDCLHLWFVFFFILQCGFSEWHTVGLPHQPL